MTYAVLAMPEQDADPGAFSGLLDLSVAAPRGFIESWTPGEIPGGATVLGVAKVGGQLAAVGSDGTRAAAWTSSFGDKWQSASVETPSSEPSFLSHIVAWDGETYGYGRVGSGAAVWRAVAPDRWEYASDISSFGTAALIDVVAGDRLIAIVEKANETVGVYVSEDGVTWREVRQRGLDGPGQAQALSVLNGRFYVVGTDCSRGMCEPSVHRSETGLSWEEAALPATVAGNLADVTVAGNELVAVGSLVGDEGAPEALILSSSDGIRWSRIGAGEMAFAPQRGFVEVLSTSPTTDAVTLLINGERYDLGVGAAVTTEAMQFVIAAVGADRVTLQLANSARVIVAGEPVTFESGPALDHVAAVGERMVVSGRYLSTDVDRSAAVVGLWATIDGGGKWARSTTDGGALAGAVTPYLVTTRIVLVGPASDHTRTWASEWDAGAAEELDYASSR